MKKFLLISLLAYGYSYAYTQSLSPEIIASGGHYFQHSDAGSLAGTLGETFTETIENETILTQGFHQVYFMATPVFNTTLPDYSWKIYPNPTTDQVFFETDLVGDLSIELVDLYGRMLMKKPLQNGQVSFDLSIYPNALYLLQLKENQQLIKSWKIKKAGF